MDNLPAPAQALLILSGTMVVAGCVGAAFTLGVAAVCRLLKWAPVNVSHNTNIFKAPSEEA
jgi:hypothetical protein